MRKNLTEIFSRQYGVAAVMLLLMLARAGVMLGLETHTSYTIDEPANLRAAENVVYEEQLWRIKDSAMPITIVNAYVGHKILNFRPTVDPALAYRIFSIVFNQIAVPLSFFLARLLGASSPIALVFCLLVSFDPSILHHSILINVDGMMASVFLLLAVVAVRWTQKQTMWNLTLFGLILGLIQGVKFSATYAIPICAFWVYLASANPLKRRRFFYSLSLLGFAWFGLNCAYGFNQLGTPFDQIEFKSALFWSLKPILKAFPTPLPVDFLQGMDWVFSIDRGERINFLRGQIYHKGIWSYFLYCLLLKTPIPSLIAASVGWICVYKNRKTDWNISVTFIAYLFGIYFVYFSLIFNNQIGIRYILPIYPLFLLGVIWFRWNLPLFLICFAYFTGSMVYNWPNYIGYFNEFVFQKQDRWWYLGDSNLSWQNETGDWQKEKIKLGLKLDQVACYLIPVNEDFYLDPMAFSGILNNESTYRFLRENFSPVGTFQGGWLKFHVSSKQILEKFNPVLSVEPVNGSIQCVQHGLDYEGEILERYRKVRTFNSAPVRWQGDFSVDEIKDGFFQLAMRGSGALRVNNHTLLSFEKEPVIKSYGVLIKLKPGTYHVEVLNEEHFTPATLGFSAQLLTESDGIPVNFCPKKN